MRPRVQQHARTPGSAQTRQPVYPLKILSEDVQKRAHTIRHAGMVISEETCLQEGIYGEHSITTLR